jgi:TRAP transporter TAXI family solute receptor
MLRNLVLALTSVALFGSGGGMQASAQSVPKSLQGGGSEKQIKQRKNTWTIGLVGGQSSGTYMRFADELAQALDDGDNLRILPIVSYGAASNLEDLLYLNNIDIAITQSDVFEFFRTERKTPNLDSRVHFITRLPIAELHVLARAEIRTLEDLSGKKVSFGPAGSGSSLTGSIVFQRLGVNVEQIMIDNSQALHKLQSGEIAALVRVVGRPVDFFSRIPANSGLHLLSIPYSKKFADYYTIGELSSRDYPTLIPAGERVDTIAVPAVLAVYNWRQRNERYIRIERFVERLFANIDKLQKPPFHPKWRDVNLSATVPGWKRFDVAERLLAKMPSSETENQLSLNREFQQFLTRSGETEGNQNHAEREQLFREFINWRKREGAARSN